MKTKSLTFNERQIFVTDSNKNVVSLLSIKFWDLLKIIQAVKFRKSFFLPSLIWIDDQTIPNVVLTPAIKL